MSTGPKNPSAVIIDGVPKKADVKDLFYYCEPFGKVEGAEFVDNNCAVVTFKYAADAAALKNYKKFSILHTVVGVKYYDRRPVQPKQTEQKRADFKPLPVQPKKQQNAPAQYGNDRNDQRRGNNSQQQQQYQQQPQTRQQQQQQPRQQQQQAEPQQKTLILQNIPKGLDTDDCEYSATEYGQVKSTEWINNRSIVIEFKTVAAANRMLAAADNFTMLGHPVRVKPFQPAQPSAQTAGGGNNGAAGAPRLSRKEQELVQNLKMVQADIQKQIKDIQTKK